MILHEALHVSSTCELQHYISVAVSHEQMHVNHGKPGLLSIGMVCDRTHMAATFNELLDHCLQTYAQDTVGNPSSQGLHFVVRAV